MDCVQKLKSKYNDIDPNFISSNDYVFEPKFSRKTPSKCLKYEFTNPNFNDHAEEEKLIRQKPQENPINLEKSSTYFKCRHINYQIKNFKFVVMRRRRKFESSSDSSPSQKK